MSHYHLIVLIHPDHPDQISSLSTQVEDIISKHKGTLHLKKDVGCKKLTKPIKGSYTAHAIVMDIEVDRTTLARLEDALNNNTFENNAYLCHAITMLNESNQAYKTKIAMLDDPFVQESHAAVARAQDILSQRRSSWKGMFSNILTGVLSLGISQAVKAPNTASTKTNSVRRLEEIDEDVSEFEPPKL